MPRRPRAAGRPGVHRRRPGLAAQPAPAVAAGRRAHVPPGRSPPTRVRFAGDIVAAVVAESREASVDAAELVMVDYEPLPAVIDIREAAEDEVAAVRGGRHQHLPAASRSRRPRRGHASPTATWWSRLQREPAAARPARSSPARRPREFGEDGKLTIWLSTQTPHQDKVRARRRARPRARAGPRDRPRRGRRLRRQGPGRGGHSRRVAGAGHRRPVQWTETRSEHMVAMHHGRAQWIDFELGGDRDGKLKALRLKILQDAGAYPGIGAFLPILTQMMSSGVYAIPKIEVDVTSVVTNTTPIGPVRGAGRPEATQMLERAIDMFAAETGLDPAEVRRRNFIATDAFPFHDRGRDQLRHRRLRRGAGAGAGAGRLRGAAPRAGAAPRRRRRARCSASASASTWRSPTASARASSAPSRSPTTAARSSAPARSPTARATRRRSPRSSPSAPASPLEKIQVVAGDTDRVPRGTGTYGSKSTQIGGAAAGQASELLVDRAKQLAADAARGQPRRHGARP